MAIRPLFIPDKDTVGVFEKSIDFVWAPGMAASQKKKSIASLHHVARDLGFNKVLEVSSKSEENLGINLSAFNLMITTRSGKYEFSVESAFQGSKLFEKGGPYKDLFFKPSLDAKRDIRLKESGNLIGFKFFGVDFPITPRTYFYDWVYINALNQNEGLNEELMDYDGFSDIEFNPKKSINCQAHSVALFVSLRHNDMLGKALESPENFLTVCRDVYDTQRRNIGVQDTFI